MNVPMRPAFFVNTAACSGCKACQVACKDKNGLAVGVLWRRVVEVSGGRWRREGEAWVQDVFAYHVSVACNHCERPICVEACPSGAMHRREDGVVLVDGAKCLGCRYCAMACPYGAPQYDPAAGRMTKCTLCEDELALGRPPACVAACPMRVLELVTREDAAARSGGAAEVFPLPPAGLTEPSLGLRPHASAARGASEGRIANREEDALP